VSDSSSGRATGIALVARPEELSLTEAVEAAEALRRLGLPVAGAVLNGVRDRRFADDEEPVLRALAAGDDRRAAVAGRAGLADLEGARHDAAYRERLAREARLPVRELPQLVRRRMGVDALRALAERLGDAA